MMNWFLIKKKKNEKLPANDNHCFLCAKDRSSESSACHSFHLVTCLAVVFLQKPHKVERNKSQAARNNV